MNKEAIITREHQDFHVGLKAFIAREGKLLILQDNEGFWELPGGRIEAGETHKDLKGILIREVGEELGGGFKYKISSVFHTWMRRPNTDAEFYIFLVGFGCEYMGGGVVLSPEHKNFKWIDKDGAEKLDFENTYREAIEYYFDSQ